MKGRDDRRVETAVVVATVTILGIAASATGLALLAASWEAPAPDSWGFRGFTVLFATAYGGVGAILAARRPENRVGWILLAAGTFSAVQLLVEEYAPPTPSPVNGRRRSAGATRSTSSALSPRRRTLHSGRCRT